MKKKNQYKLTEFQMCGHAISPQLHTYVSHYVFPEFLPEASSQWTTEGKDTNEDVFLNNTCTQSWLLGGCFYFPNWNFVGIN